MKILTLGSILLSMVMVVAGALHFRAFPANHQEQTFGVEPRTQLVSQGATGTSTQPVAGEILQSWANGSYGPTAIYEGTGIDISTSTYRRLTIAVDTSTVAVFDWPFSLSNPNGQTGVSTSTLVRFLGGASTTAFSANTAAFGQTATSTFGSDGALALASALAVTSGGTGATVLDDIVGTANQLTVTNGADTIIGGDATLSLPAHVIFPGSINAGNSTTTNATSTSLNVTSAYVDFDAFTSALLLTGAGGIVAEYAGTSCTNQFVRSLDAVGAATCATVSAGDVSLANLTATDGSITFSGTYNGSTARTIGVNVGNAFVWTSTHDFGGATSVEMVNGTGPTVDAVGEFALDTTENELLIATSTNAAAPAVIKPFEWKGFVHSSSSQGLGTTTKPFFIAPPNGAGYFDSITCHATSTTPNKAFISVQLKDESFNRMNDLIASATETNTKLTVNNSFTASEVIYADIGTSTAGAPFLAVTCYAKIIYTRN